MTEINNEDIDVQTSANNQLKHLSKNYQIDGSTLRNGFSIDINPLDATFRDSSRAPLHSWYPYLEGYSPRFVQSVIQEYLPNAKRIKRTFDIDLFNINN